MSPWGTAPLLACVGDRTPPRRSEGAFKVLALGWVQIETMLISLASAPARARIQLMTSCWSVRYPKPDPAHWLFTTKEFTATMTSVSWSRTGPPESPKQVPPRPPPGLVAIWTLKPAVLWLPRLVMKVVAISRL